MALGQNYWEKDQVVGAGQVPGAAAAPTALPPPPEGESVALPPPPAGDITAPKPGPTSPTKHVLTPDELKQKYPHLDPHYSYQEVTNPEGGPAGIEVLPRTGGKMLPQTRWDSVKADVSTYSGLKTSLDSFNPEFAGNWAGTAENLGQAALGDRESGMLGVGTPGQRQWWANWYSNDNIIRAGLYGASLTKGEQAAYDKTTIAPYMDPEIVRANVANRAEIIRKAIGRDRKALIAEGYNQDTLDALAGDFVQDFDQETPGTQTATGETVTPGQDGAKVSITDPDQPQPGDEKMTTAPPPIFAGTEPQAGVTQGPTKIVDNPALKGANKRVRDMEAGGYSIPAILGMLKKEFNPSNADLMDIKGDLQKVREWRKQNPQFKGPTAVDVEKLTVPTTGWERASGSEGGSLGIAAADTFTGGHLDNIIGWTGGDAEEASVGIDASRAAHPGYALGGDVLGGLAAWYGGGKAVDALETAGRTAFGLAPKAAQVGKIGAFAPRAMAGDAGLGAWTASGQGGTQIADPTRMAIGAATGLGTGVATRGVINSLGAAVSPTGGELAPLYEQGVRSITTGQRAGAKSGWIPRAANRLEQGMASIPFIGAIQASARHAAIDEMQRGAFNMALGELGLQLPDKVMKGTAAQGFMKKAFDAAYDKARGAMSVSLDGTWTQEFGQLLQDVKTLDVADAKTFENIAGIIGGKIRKAGGTINGSQYKHLIELLNDKIGAQLKKPGGLELGVAVGNLKTLLDGAARRTSGPAAAEALDNVDRGFAKAVIIQHAGLRPGGEVGEFSGNALLKGVQRGDPTKRSTAFLSGEANMQPYAEAAAKLGPTVADSGTPERLMTAGAATGAAGATGGIASVAGNPMVMLPWILNTAGNLPGVRRVVGAAMAPNPSKIKGFTDQARAGLEASARYGGPLLIPMEQTGE